jgi:hypothetical protein
MADRRGGSGGALVLEALAEIAAINPDYIGKLCAAVPMAINMPVAMRRAGALSPRRGNSD